MTLRTFDFDVQRCAGAPSGVTAIDGESFNWDEYLPAKPYAMAGRQIWLNGWNANSQFPLINAFASGIGVIQPLVMASPPHFLFPTVSPMGAGPVFGTGYVWRIRYKNRVTGDVSGLSPMPPWRIDMGKPIAPLSDSYVGQYAAFRVLCGTSDVPSYCDTIQLFRSFSGDLSIFTLVKEKDILALQSSPGYVDFIDDVTDAELGFHFTTAGLQPNPSYSEGMIPQCVKAHPHSSGRLLLYGCRSEAPYRSGTVSVIVGSTLVTRTDTTTTFTINKVGQRFRMLRYSSTAIDDPTIYQIVSAGAGGDTIRVTPEIQPSTLLTTQGVTYSAITFEILDNRSPRAVYPSEPNDPTSFDILRQFEIGSEGDLLHIFSLRGVTYGQTTEGIYRLLNDSFLAPSGSLAAAVATQRVAPEGTTGFESGCMTPYGWTFAHATLGMRLFDGNAPPQGYETLGTTTPCVPLGGAEPTDAFGPHDQFHGAETDAYSALTGLSRTGFEPTLLSEVRCYSDPVSQLCHVFYVPAGDWSLVEEMVFDAEARCWRGPWRRCATAAGTFKNADGTDCFGFGNDTGGLWIDDYQNHDMYPGTVPASATATSGSYYVVVKSGTFDEVTYKDEGVPIVLTCATATQVLELTDIVDVIDNGTIILRRPVVQPTKLYTFQEAGIRWLAEFGWIDVDEPIQPKVCHQLRLRVQKLPTDASAATIGVLKDGDEDLSTLTGELGTPFALGYDAEFPAHRGARIEVGSRLFAPVAYGTSTNCHPKVTKMVGDLRVDAGA